DIQKVGNSDLYNSLIEELSSLVDSSGNNILQQFVDTINQFTDIEAYIFLQLFISFVSICYQVKESWIKNQNLANQIYNKIYLTGNDITINKSGSIELSLLDRQIDQKKKEKAEKNFILAQLPAATNFVDGIQ